MARELKKTYSEDPNPWMNLAHRNNVIVYPEWVGNIAPYKSMPASKKKNMPKQFKIAVKTLSKKGKDKVQYGKKNYDTKTVNQGLMDAYKFVYEKLKKEK